MRKQERKISKLEKKKRQRQEIKCRKCVESGGGKEKIIRGITTM